MDHAHPTVISQPVTAVPPDGGWFDS